MQSVREVIIETGTSIGELKVEQVTVVTSEGDIVDEYYDVSMDGDVKHRRCSHKGAVRALGHYMGGL